MNKHFEDTQYYLKRASETAKRGVTEELSPVQEKFRSITGREEEPELSRIDEIREELRKLQDRAEGETREAIASARSRLDDYRSQRSEASD
ncbi:MULTISPECIES: hypothetical protein [unclassified Haladaptatus]|uniref:DUF7553 family protein n=1 Tax=unclassified Haladaptatus TaxID=2622732 RepID=UPI0023E8C140|nr:MULTISPECIES: hypothetical protein [unclassified Haladaptatus]